MSLNDWLGKWQMNFRHLLDKFYRKFQDNSASKQNQAIFDKRPATLTNSEGYGG
tara:strand:+ start:980 stop:1141 length:162 start_codon:yes stop_codon:yes gene_type:complete